MKNFIKKLTAVAFSVIGILSSVPSAFCTRNGESSASTNKDNQNDQRGHIGWFYAMIVGKYLNGVEDIANLEMTNLEFKDISERFHINPVEINSEEDLLIFPNMETYRNEGRNSKGYIYKFPDRKDSKIKRMIYLPYSFGAVQYRKILVENGIMNNINEFSDEWKRTVKIKDGDPAKGCDLIYKNGEKEIIFMFSPCANGEFEDVTFYNDLVSYYDIEEASIPLEKEFSIPDSVQSTSYGAFKGCNTLEKVNIPETVKKIDVSTFEGCKALKEVSIPESVETIGEKAFKGCDKLEKINLPKTIKNIEKSTFEGCKALKEVNIPKSVKAIKENAFEGCNHLETINIPDSVKTIEKYAFSDCDALTEINIPNSVENIYASAFGHGSRLRRIRFNGKTYDNVDDFMIGFYMYKFTK